MQSLEREDERYLVERVTEHGGLCFKFTSPGARGVPDRIVITSSGDVHFVELKRASPPGHLSQAQLWQMNEMRKRNCKVWILWGREDVDKFINVIFPEREEVMR